MNKQRYLAELQRLLVFMTEEDRELTVRRYADMFDAAGPEGEEKLVAELGSPTKAAIGLSRGYEPGRLSETPPAAEKKPEPKAALTQTEDDPWGDLPTFELPEISGILPDEEPDGAREEPAPAEENAPSPEEDIMPGPAPVRHAAPEEPWREGGRAAVYERSMPLGLGVPLFVLVIAALGVPLAALFLAAMAVCVAPGCALAFGAYLAAVGGLWCLAYIADAILMFGLAFLILALGLLALWCGVRLAAKLVNIYIEGVRWLAGELLGRKVTDDEDE